MGLRVKTKGELYQLIDTTSDERIHDEKWVTKDEAKAALIERAYWDFVRKSIEIYMDFPKGYGNFEFSEKTGLRWLIDNWDYDKFDKKFQEICKELNLDF